MFAKASYGTNYFVSPKGDDTNSGLTESDAWRSVAFAASSKSPVKAGDTVYVKAGVYNEMVGFVKGGTKEAPIVFQGYCSTPNDNPKLEFSLDKELTGQAMPLLDGQDRMKGTAMQIVGGVSYLVIKNFQIKNYLAGVVILDKTIHHITIDQLIISKLGALDGSYSGTAFAINESSHNTIKNCIIANAQAEGISFVGNDTVIENCKVYSNEVLPKKGAEGTDYYIVVSGENNIIRNCYIERIIPSGLGEFPHVGHGIGFKDASQHNLVENCTAVNLGGGGFYVRWGNVKNNKFINCKAYGPKNKNENDAVGFLCRNGAENNIFENCTSEGCYAAVSFLNSTSEGSGDNSQYAAYKNSFKNCIFKNSTYVINFCAYSRSVSNPVVDNLFINCMIDNADALCKVNRANRGTQLIKCHIKGVKRLKAPSSDKKLDMIFQQTKVPKSWEK